MAEGVEPLWATGPGEVLRHGIVLLREDTDTNRRLALISIDNSVELMMQTYVSLPKRITGIGISRRERDEICSSFPNLLDGIENWAADCIVGINLGEVEWFHRLRNELYHQGNGLTVERSKVEYYAELAATLFSSLFGVKLVAPSTDNMTRLGEFFDAWIQIEKSLLDANADGKRRHPMAIANSLAQDGKITREQYEKLDQLRRIRNSVAHGEKDASDKLSSSFIESVKAFARGFALGLAGLK